MTQVEIERKQTRLRRTGGSWAATLPSGWLKRHQIEEVVELVDTPDGILIRSPQGADGPEIESEPEFATFLHFLLKDSLAHPEKLGDVGELMADDQDLVTGVEPD